ncbi:unnamed protein product, partial [Ranitomeya imitator]
MQNRFSSWYITQLIARERKQKSPMRLDFQIQQLERRLARLKGEVNTDEKHALEMKVSDLSKTFDERKVALNILNSQHKKLQGDVRNIKRELEKTGQEKENLISKMEELKLFNSMSDKALKKLRTSKQDLMVDDNILKLEIKRLRDMLHNKADDVFSLEKRKLNLQTAMKERTQEIAIHKEMLKSQLRLADQERQTMSQEFHERLAKVDKMRKRFEIITVAMMPPEGEEEKSQAYYIIKAAQEKEELQRNGDELDAKIRKAEKEINALENTLQVINGCNNSYRKSFHKVTETTWESEVCSRASVNPDEEMICTDAQNLCESDPGPDEGSEHNVDPRSQAVTPVSGDNEEDDDETEIPDWNENLTFGRGMKRLALRMTVRQSMRSTEEVEEDASDESDDEVTVRLPGQRRSTGSTSTTASSTPTVPQTRSRVRQSMRSAEEVEEDASNKSDDE